MRKLLVLVALAACGGGGGGGGGGDDAAVIAPDANLGPPEPIHYIGRFDRSDPAGPKFEWSGSALWTRFSGTGLSIDVDGYPNQFDLTVDGTTTVLVTSGGAETLALAQGLADGEHDVRLTRRTEAFFGPTQFLGFTGGTLVDTARPGRMIEMIGDSITCGYGVLGVGPSCSFGADTEAETHAWGGLAAGALGAAHVAIAWSGKGVYRNCCGDTSEVLPVLYERVMPNEGATAYDFTDYTPQVVVVNLGTNDFSDGDPGQPYVDATVAFVAQLRGHYPGAWIVLASSPMLGEPEHTTEAGYLQQAITAAGDDHVTFLDVATQLDSDGYGCDYHPNEITAQKMADALVAKLHDLLGW